MQNLDMKTPDITSMNIEKIWQLFPNVITEKEDENWKITKAIDFELLKQQLSKEIVEDCEERYTLNWPWKKASLLKANTPINKTLRPVRENSVNFDTTENLYLEWDNFEVLKILQESYLWKVKMIYIDPPYNTGKDFVYKDNFTKNKSEADEEAWVYDDEGWKLFKNTDTNGRFHSDWLSMMYERLTVARDLLKDDWVIFMSIDDNEVHNLRKIADEIFGEENFVAEIVWQTRYNPISLTKNISKIHEYVLIFSKNSEKVSFNDLPRNEEQLSRYKNYDNDPRWKWTSDNLTAWPVNEKKLYKITTPNGRIVEPSNWLCWIFTEERMNEMIKDNRIWFWEDGWNMPRLKRFLSEVRNWIVSTTFWEYNQTWWSQWATKETKELFWWKKFFDYPKWLELLKKILTIWSNKDDIILDFFSWSATTAHAVMQLNAEDWGNRKFICVQIPEETDEKSEAFKAWYKNICEIWKERIRRAWKKIIEDKVNCEARESTLVWNEENLKERKTPLDIWFRVYKTDSSNMKDVFYHPSELEQSSLLDVVSNIKEDSSSEDLLTQVILDLGLTLDLPIEKKTILGNTVYFVAGNSLVACFDENVDFGIVDEIAKEEPLRVVFRDSCFKTDSDRINFENRFKKLSGESDIRVI